MDRFKDLLYSSEMSIFSISYHDIGGFPSGSSVRNPPVMQKTQETRVQSLGGEDPLEEGLATHSSILAWRVPKDREAWQVPAIGLQRVRHN